MNHMAGGPLVPDIAPTSFRMFERSPPGFQKSGRSATKSRAVTTRRAEGISGAIGAVIGRELLLQEPEFRKSRLVTPVDVLDGPLEGQVQRAVGEEASRDGELLELADTLV